jgi:hypothetical protein
MIAHSGTLAGGDCVAAFRARGVLQPDKANKSQLAFNHSLIEILI